ncbi:hypothetical protein SEA_EMIANNA_2 [Gordonia phage Emianna]|uniref:Uncharacterized protein n=2 Tax=Foxborovirus TaxID=2948710 RepID=A0A345L4T1_9CAUD|nr:hypothetical protein KNT99_gp03 [Gordonia phage NatB6]YP_010098890.1 hypothetical protein KNU15_gp02 [Gordonia phage Emianna]AYD84117.1 hypothetical protein SEA_JIFALL16_2 [Gordonia phage Jifall16]AYD84274.1 hypothetical protein SEA_KURT_2 [Gordonia phage Kurt]AXH50283.1 hypothetical protein SEA_NATB6_3 [Gordonia phage NatB6]AYD83387.1 hypothetical protein SEA_EMIANNA_2 [Gordonia phage Emianna]
MILRTETRPEGARIKLDCDTKSCSMKGWITIRDVDLEDLPRPEERPRGKVRTRLARHGWTTSVDTTRTDNRTFCPLHSIKVPEDEIVETRPRGRPRLDGAEETTEETPSQMRKRMLREKKARADQRRAQARKKYHEKRNTQ